MVTMATTNLPIPREASNFDEVSMHQSLLFSDSLQVLLQLLLKFDILWLKLLTSSFMKVHMLLFSAKVRILIHSEDLVWLLVYRTFVTSAIKILNCGSLMYFCYCERIFRIWRIWEHNYTQLPSILNYLTQTMTKNRCEYIWSIKHVFLVVFPSNLVIFGVTNYKRLPLFCAEL